MSVIKQKMIAFQLPEESYTQLQSLAEKHFRSVSAELRAIISSYIDLNKDNIGENVEGISLQERIS